MTTRAVPAESAQVESDTLEHWRMCSWITRDKQEHHRVVRRAAELLTGQDSP